ncbi:trypsin-like peptidase domain-containing protein [Chitinimonas sp.]|uniref:InlB B-repeat-containing protein n=1 Tax=Chitinimonas sp. TaxID=1934313 RepID=UPI0035ADE5BA
MSLIYRFCFLLVAVSSQTWAGSPDAATVHGRYAGAIPRIALTQPDVAELTDDVPARPGAGVPLRVGIARQIKGLANAGALQRTLRWERQPDGSHLAAITIHSPSALGLRLGIRVEQLPATATLRFYAGAQAAAVEVSAREVHDVLALNKAARDGGADADVYWGPIIAASDATVEIELPAGESISDVRLSIPQLSHLFASAPTFKDAIRKIGDAVACNLNASCYSQEWGNESNAVARMSYVSGGSSYTCTGTLLGDRAGSGTPYFLSANHCISTQASASSLITYWFFRSASCDAPSTTDPRYQSLPGGAALLYAAANTDTSFLQLLRNPPPGAVYAEWSPEVPPLGASVTGIHHPRGDLQKISFGTTASYNTCQAADNGTFDCSSQSQPAGTGFLGISLSNGISEPGSSGSGLWMMRDGQHYLIGQLYGGNSSCSAASSTDAYGRFDVAYTAALSRWLDGSGGRASALVVNLNGAGTVISSPAAINCTSSCSASVAANTALNLTATPSPGYRFAGWSGACSGAGACSLSMASGSSVTATFTKTSAVAASQVDCLLSWAERSYPALFSPAGVLSQNNFGYRFRYYTASNSFLGVDDAAGNIAYLGSDGRQLDLGPAQPYLLGAACN